MSDRVGTCVLPILGREKTEGLQCPIDLEHDSYTYGKSYSWCAVCHDPFQSLSKPTLVLSLKNEQLTILI